MNDNNNSSSSDNLDNASDILDSSHSLKQLARAISISPERLLQICMSQQQLKNKLKEFNDVAVLKIQGESYNSALIYLQEAEKLLEAAVNRGNKKIDRIFIICTLQNQACAYQKLWELQKSAEYMEAIIHNMESQIKNSNSELQEIYFAQDVVDDKESMKKCISKLTLMGLYYLQYLAVTSQIKDHETAYKTSVKALKNFKMACQKCYKLQTIQSETHLQSVIVHNNMMGELASISQEPEIDRIPEQIKQTKRTLAKLRQTVSRKKSITDKAIICFRDFAIGEVMQISPITLNELIRKINAKEEVTNMSKLYKALYISICFFSMATQKRLMCTEVSRKFQNSRRAPNAEMQITEVLKISQVYHLRAIYIASKYIPCENKYLQHIIKSLKNHYQIDLLDASSSDLIQQVSSIDLQSQNLVASYDPGQNVPHTNLNTYSNTNRLKSQKSERRQKITRLLKSQKSSKKSKRKPEQSKMDENAEGPHFGNTIIKKQIEHHYKKKVYKSEKHIKTIFSENPVTKEKKDGSKSKSKSNKKTGRNSKNSKVEKKQSMTVYTEKKTNPTSVRSIEHGANRLAASKKAYEKNVPHPQHYVSEKAFKTSQYTLKNNEPVEVQSHTSPFLKKSQQKGAQKSKLKKKKKPITHKQQTNNSKEKSKSKSRSKSTKRIANTSKQDKNIKNTLKVKKKQNRLQQQYFAKPEHKRKNGKTRHEYKSTLKKNSVKMQESSPPGRNTVNNLNSGSKNVNWKHLNKNY